MYKGIYIALSGAVLKRRNMDVFAQNIANANTPGYKKERMSFKDYMIPVDNKTFGTPDGRSMAELSKTVTDFASGPVSRTGNPLDVAINGEGFFALEDGKYTRNGGFMISGDGYLVTKSGVKVLGEGGPIPITGSGIEFTGSGEVMVDNTSAGKLQLVDFPDKSVLRKVDGGMFASDEPGEPVGSGVVQGYLEESNVNVIQEMVSMITSTREFESYQKMIQAFDEASSKSINELGK